MEVPLASGYCATGERGRVGRLDSGILCRLACYSRSFMLENIQDMSLSYVILLWATKNRGLINKTVSLLPPGIEPGISSLLVMRFTIKP